MQKIDLDPLSIEELAKLLERAKRKEERLKAMREGKEGEEPGQA